MHYILSFISGFENKSIIPGQFISIKVKEGSMLLRRPFSIFNVEDGKVFIFYRVTGKGTKILSEKKPGDELDILGILGNGFSIDDRNKTFALVSGGMGIAPLFFLAKILLKKGKEVFFYIGGKTESEIFFEKELTDLGCNVCVATDDGSKNIRGTVCDAFEPECKKRRFSIIYSCGPKEMLKKVALIAEKEKIPCRISLEEVMACGFGVCLGCAVAVKRGGTKYKMVCKDVPVFEADEIVF